MTSDRDLLLAVAAVAWYFTDPADIGFDYPSDEYSTYAIKFADTYRKGDPLLPAVTAINSPMFGRMRDMTADIIIAYHIWRGLPPHRWTIPDADSIVRQFESLP